MPRQAKGTRPALLLRGHGLCIGSYGAKIQTHCIYRGDAERLVIRFLHFGPFLDIAVHAQL